MAYVIRKLDSKNRSWKPQFATYVGGKQRVKDIAVEHYVTHGFRPEMSYEEAVARRDQLNALEKEKTHQARRVAITERLDEEDQKLNAYLSELDVKRFEETVLYGRDFQREAAARNRTGSHWRMAKRIILHVRMVPSEWAANAGAFYDFFRTNEFSLSYLQKILPILNKWGEFLSHERQQYFKPIPYPVGRERQRIADAYFNKEGASQESAPITPEALASVETEFTPETYNWLFLTVWLGLRPFEVDSLTSPENWRVEQHGDVPVLFVYQSKLTSVDRAKRWKPIPLLFDEQKKCLGIIKAQAFKRPAVKTVKAHLGDTVNTYGGRKGFTDLMLGRGQKFEDISSWLGHTTIERTWRNYKNKQRVSFTKPTTQS